MFLPFLFFIIVTPSGSYGKEGYENFAVVFLVFYIVFLLCLMWAALASSVKRYHDRNKSGWWVLVVLIPFLGPIIQLVELGFLPGIDEGNMYGVSTKEDSVLSKKVTIGDLMNSA